MRSTTRPIRNTPFFCLRRTTLKTVHWFIFKKNYICIDTAEHCIYFQIPFSRLAACIIQHNFISGVRTQSLSTRAYFAHWYPTACMSQQSWVGFYQLSSQWTRSYRSEHHGTARLYRIGHPFPHPRQCLRPKKMCTTRTSIHAYHFDQMWKTTPNGSPI